MTKWAHRISTTRESRMKRPAYRAAVTYFLVAGLVAFITARFSRDVLSAEPPAHDGFWKTADPATLGLDVEALDRHREHAEKSGAHAVLVVYKDQIVSEWYSPRYREKMPTMSSVKSWTGLLVGMLIADGKIGSVDDPVSKYLPEWAEGEKAQVTLRHLLTMSSGLKRRLGKEPGEDQSVGFVADKNAFDRALATTTATKARRCCHRSSTKRRDSRFRIMLASASLNPLGWRARI